MTEQAPRYKYNAITSTRKDPSPEEFNRHQKDVGVFFIKTNSSPRLARRVGATVARIARTTTGDPKRRKTNTTTVGEDGEDQ